MSELNFDEIDAVQAKKDRSGGFTEVVAQANQPKPQNTQPKRAWKTGPKKDPNLKMISLNFDKNILAAIDTWCASNPFMSRTEFINRAAAKEIKRLMTQEIEQ